MSGKVGVDIEGLAALARIKLGESEKKRLREEFEDVLNYVAKLGEVDVSGVGEREAAKTTELENVFRSDEEASEPGKFTDALLDAAPLVEKGFIKVKRALD